MSRPSDHVTEGRSRVYGWRVHLVHEEAARQWTIQLPPGTRLISANGREHWRERAAVTAELRRTAGWLARSQKIPRLERAHVLAVYEPPDRRRRDPANLYPSVKACVDGLTDAQVWADDDAEHVTGPDMRLGLVCRWGRLTLTITELPAARARQAITKEDTQ